MNETNRQPFKLHLPGLLRVLAEHLYSNRNVAIRELIQNAHDSCVRRAAQSGEPNYRPAIRIRIQAADRRLVIEDNGSGMTAQEIDDYLATIGRSYTRELKEDIALLTPQRAADLVGQFGFGFLSAFLIASHVTLTTRSWRPGSEAIRWTSTGDESYETAPAHRDSVGTTIVLELKPAASFALRANLLVERIREFADFLPTPIYLEDEPAPLNVMTPPWEARDRERAEYEWIARVFDVKDPLCRIELTDHAVDLGGDRVTVPLQGVLFVPPGSIASVREYGDMRVYIRRMFICKDEKELLPPWARFVRGAVDCRDLQPTAARESLHQDETFAAVQQAIEEQLSAGLRRIAAQQPEVWRQIVEGHTDVLMGWAVRDDSFFEQVSDLLPLRTSRGSMTLPDYLAQTDDACFYITRELGSLQEQLLAEGNGYPVIDASWFAVAPFLNRYAMRRPRMRLTKLDGDLNALLRPLSDPAFDALLDYFDRCGVRSRMAAFQPAQMPAIMDYPEDARRLGAARQAVDRQELPGPLANLIADYLTDRTEGRDDLNGTLYLNGASPLIRRLALMPPSSAPRDAVLTLIYQTARLFASRSLDTPAAVRAFGEATAAMEALLQ